MYLLSGAAALVFLLGGAACWQYKISARLNQELGTTKVQIAVQESTIKTMADNMSETVNRLKYIQEQTERIDTVTRKSVEVFNDRHDLNNLAIKKNSLIQKKINTASATALLKIQNLTDPNFKF